MIPCILIKSYYELHVEMVDWVEIMKRVIKDKNLILPKYQYIDKL